MSNVVNLNRFRKQKARKDAERQAAENRVRYGRTKAEKEREAAAEAEAKRLWDGAQRDDDPSA